MSDSADIELTGFDEVLAALDSLPEQVDDFQRQALRAANDVIRPALVAATPYSTETPTGTALRPGELKGAVTSRISVGHLGADSTLTVGFGKLGYVARFVDEGHENPTAKAQNALKRTPPHPFVRNVIDTTAEAAHDAYVTTMTALVEGAINGS
ncbi:HK97-gp10 family putative phage morphogenesis protein [Terriglobus roseus]|uniref:Phage protein, HK97 gp10 family n=1 Tax=Terriglobus roseus TaxID=392734 RepID=A0A1H4J3U4_9BACT|nr:HK97-gp10 family putative phage morphogenesis protein [Terriglobus roseus]SEB40636.1 phage protein, HK97 gp10 family [Terriglobus roseus]